MADLKLNPKESEPGLKDLLDQFKKDILLSINCHAIATVESFDSDNQTVTATVNYSKTKFVFNQATNSYAPTAVNYPLVVSCPVVILGGGSSNLTFPITKGDECLLLFNDRDLSTWFEGNSFAQVPTTRLHSFSDAVAIVGLRSSHRSISGYDSSHAMLSWGETKVGISESLVLIANATGTLKTVINGLIDLLSASFGENTPNSGDPLNPSAVTQLTTYKTIVEGLLE